MKLLLHSIAAALAFSCLPAAPLQAQVPMSTGGQGASAKPLPSPAVEAHVTLNGKDITVKYNSPQMRGRTIMGGLVPYGQVWRTGANPATSFVTATGLKIGDLKVPAGSYTLYTLPAAPGTPWQLIINKQTGQWGTEYHQEQDLGRTPMQSGKLPAPQEGMSITFEHSSGHSTELHVKWETTDQRVTITAE